MIPKKFRLLLALFVLSASLMAQTWERKQNINLPARIQCVGFSLGEKGYVAGGIAEKNPAILDDLQQYDPASNTWQTISTLPEPLRGAVAFTIGNQAIITTGTSSSGLNRKTLIWNDASRSWSSGTPFPAGKTRMAAVGIGLGTRGYVSTGFDGQEKPLNDLWEYNPASGEWLEKAPLPGSPRSYATGFAIHSKLYVGLGNNGSNYLQDWWEYSPETNSWKKMADIPGEARTGAIGFSANGKGYIVGGINMEYMALRDVWEFDPVLNTWTQLNMLAGFPRGYGVGFSINDRGFIATGASSESYLYDVWECFPKQMTQQLVDFEEKFVEFGEMNASLIILPNPFFYRFCIKLRHPYTGLLNLTIRNMDGRAVFQKSFNKDAEYFVNCWEIDIAADGLYIFEIKDASGSVNYKRTMIHKSFGI